jgi:hypothetical protein
MYYCQNREILVDFYNINFPENRFSAYGVVLCEKWRDIAELMGLVSVFENIIKCTTKRR